MVGQKIRLFAFLFVFNVLASWAAAPVPKFCDLEIDAEANIAQILKDYRPELAKYLKEKKIPIFYKEFNGNKIPVILVNGQTVSELKPVLENSVGTQVYMQPDWNNDHGSLRIGGIMADVDTPGARNFGELHETGISWKDVGKYVAKRGDGSSVIIESSYALTHNELITAQYYHRVRKSAIFRVKFTFGGDVEYPKSLNMLEGGGEHCFIFSQGQACGSHISEITKNITNLGVKNVDEFMKTSSVKKFLAEAQTKIMQADVNDPKILNDQMLVPLTGGLKASMPGLKKEELQELGNWLVALDVTTKYKGLLNDLKVSSTFSDFGNKRTSFILIYDSADNVKAFNKANYTTNGKFWNWENQNQSPVQ